MSLKDELQALANKKDKVLRKLERAKARQDYEVAAGATAELEKLNVQLEALKAQKSRTNSDKADQLRARKFHRALTKAEQADMGKFKKSVRGLVTVHPLTALGRELGITEMTGFADKEF